MAKTSLKNKQQATPKYSTRAYTRCRLCGRPLHYGNGNVYGVMFDDESVADPCKHIGNGVCYEH